MNDIPATTPETAALAPLPAADTATFRAPPAMVDLFGKPPLLNREDANLFETLLSRVVIAARPRDPFEWILLKDYADLAWEIFRLRRAKANYINGRYEHAHRSLTSKLAADFGPAVQTQSTNDARLLLLNHGKEQGLDEDSIAAEVIVGSCDVLAALEELIASAETRRNAMLREIDYHRAGLGARLRAAPDVIEAETEDAPEAARPA